MTYNITLTNGQNLVTIADGTADTSYSSLTLFGKNYAGYGPLLDQNQVHMLENFSFVSPPLNPLQGQLWWDSSKKQLKVKKDSIWKVVSGPTVSTTQPDPVTSSIGDLWWDSNSRQLNAFNGSDWSIVGPQFTSGQGVSGAIVSTVKSTPDDVDHVIVKFYVNGTVQSILSKDVTFTVNTIPGFTVIKPGFNLPLSNGSYYGNAENALSLGGVLASNYLRGDVASTSYFPFNVQSNAGLTVGLNNDMTVNVANNGVNFINRTTGRDTDFYVNIAGVSTLALRINGTDGLVSLAGAPITTLGIATKGYVDTALATAEQTLLRSDGSTPIIGNLSPSVNSVYSLGSSVNAFAAVYATSIVGTSISSTAATFVDASVTGSMSTPTSVTSKAYVDNAITSLANAGNTQSQVTIDTIIGSAPANMSNLAAISNAINNNPNFGSSTLSLIATLAPLNNPGFTGIPTVPTAAANDSSNIIASTAFVEAAISNGNNTITQTLTNYALLNSPVFTGTPTVPTQPTNDATTRAASTAFVTSAVNTKGNSLTTTFNQTLTNYALLNSPVFIGIPQAPTPITADSSTKVATTAFVTTAINNLQAATASGGTTSGGLTMSGNLITSGNGTYDIGSASNRFGTIYATTFNGMSTSAKYADLAENYVADADYPPGTVLDFGGDHEVTLSNILLSTKLAGVVSSNPAYLMNSACTGTHVIALALQGRCPVMVTGYIQKGDILVSNGDGTAKKHMTPQPGMIIGKALESHNGDASLIEVAIGRC